MFSVGSFTKNANSTYPYNLSPAHALVNKNLPRGRHQFLSDCPRRPNQPSQLGQPWLQAAAVDFRVTFPHVACLVSGLVFL